MNLAEFADRKIAIEADIDGRSTVLCGIAAYERLPGIAAVLRIRVADPLGDFDIVLHEDQWSGPILADHQWGCDYRISLSTATLVRGFQSSS